MFELDKDASAPAEAELQTTGRHRETTGRRREAMMLSVPYISVLPPLIVPLPVRAGGLGRIYDTFTSHPQHSTVML